VRIDDLDISDEVLDKIERKHGVSWDEVEELCRYNERSHVARRARDGLYALFGRTYAGRYLLVILAADGTGEYRVVTARDQTSDERHAYRTRKG